MIIDLLNKNTFAKYIKRLIYKQIWRNRNSHNDTSVKSVFNPNLVTVGRKSYGELNIKSFKNPKEKLIIGNFVSIADDVTFILGGIHQIDTFSCYPLNSKYSGSSPENDALTKGPIIIKDEVWIGYNSTILSGITIGRGAIIAACSVVTKDVKPFSIVGGNPAKLIRMRFSDDIIKKLSSIKLNDLDDRIIKDNLSTFYDPISESIKTIHKFKY